MGKHAEKLRRLVNRDLSGWAQELWKDGRLDAGHRIRVMGTLSRALELLDTTVELIERAEAAAEEVQPRG